MEEINRLHDIADDIGSTSWGYELASALHNIAADIGEKVDEMRRVTKPEPSDSWEKWSEDFIKPPCVYCRDILGVEFDDDTELDKAFDARNQDMECRARVLAERGER